MIAADGEASAGNTDITILYLTHLSYYIDQDSVGLREIARVYPIARPVGLRSAVCPSPSCDRSSCAPSASPTPRPTRSRFPRSRRSRRSQFRPARDAPARRERIGKSTLIEAIAVACGLTPRAAAATSRSRPAGSHSALGDAAAAHRGARRPQPTSSCAPSRTSTSRPRSRRSPGPLGPRSSIYGGVSLHEQSHGAVVPRAPQPPLRPERPVHPRRARGRALTAGAARDALAHPRPRRRRLPVRDRDALADPALVPRARIYELSDDGYRAVAYDETETVTLYRSFLARPAAYHRHLR